MLRRHAHVFVEVEGRGPREIRPALPVERHEPRIDGPHRLARGEPQHRLGPRHKPRRHDLGDPRRRRLRTVENQNLHVTPSSTNRLKASAQSGCQRDSGGRFSMMSPIAQAIRFSSSDRVTSLSGHRM